MTHSSFRIAPPAADEYDAWYAGYVAKIGDADALAVLERQADTAAAMLAAIPESRAGYRYAEGKWSIRQIVLHLADAERIFAYRALRIARGDQTPLPGFDENAYAPASGADERTLADLVAELGAVRRATIALFRGLPSEAFERRGTASGATISVRALAYIIAGHERHHLEVLRERYGVAPPPDVSL